MKLILKFEQDGSVPCAWCELGDTEITNAEMAMVYWKITKQVLHAPLLCHKRCMSADRAREERYINSMELATYLAFLLQNVGLSGDRLANAIRNAALTAQLQ